MDRTFLHSWPALGFALMLVVMTGCAGNPMEGITTTWPVSFLYREKPDTIPGVISPMQRIEQYRDLANAAAGKSAGEQQRVAADLTQTIKQEQDPLVRAQIVRTLAHYPTDLSAAVLTAAMRDSSADVRSACCEAWARLRGQDAVRILSETLASDTNIDVRLAAARALGELRDPAAVDTLAMALGDSDPALQRRAVSSLESITGKDYGSDFQAWQQYARGGQPAPRRSSDSVVTRLRNLSPF